MRQVPPAPLDARAAANALLDLAEDLRIDVYVTTILKVIYFAHGWHLARFDTPLIGQPFEAWQHGPVVRVVYDQIKDLSGKAVDRRLKVLDPVAAKYVIATCELSASTRELLLAVLRSYGVHHPYKLSDMTHEAGSPWHMAWEASHRGMRPGARIDNMDIRSYFLRLNSSDMLRS